MGTDICLPVARYSHAVGLHADGTVSWTHINSSSLFIILKGTDKDATRLDDKLMLRIVQANDVLESVDVGSYIDAAAHIRRSVQDTESALSVDQLPILGVTKDAIVGLRYTLSDQRPRRVQMRMHSTVECRQVVDALENRGLYFMEQRPGSARPRTARPLTGTPQQFSPHPGSPYSSSQPSTSHPFTIQVVEAGSLSQVRPESPQRPNNGTASVPQKTLGVSHKMLAPKLIARDEALAPRDVASTRPSTAQLYLPGSLVGQSTAFCLARPSTSHPAVGDTMDQAIGQDRHQSLPHLVVNNATASSDTFGQGNSSSCHTAASAIEFSTQSEAARPFTSSSLIFPETLEHEIPPRRELPFPRPDSRHDGSRTAGTRPRSALALPPLPRPKLSMQTSVAASETNNALPTSKARPQTSMPLKRTFADDNVSSSTIGRSSTASPEKTSSTTRSSSPDAPIKKRSRMEELLQDRKHSLEKSSASRFNRMDSLADAPGEEDDMFVSKEPSPSKMPLPRDSMSPVKRANDEAFTNAHAAVSSAARRDNSLGEYAEQSFEDRQAALEDFMMQNLENPDFTKLCKDVENCWKRIALGL